MKQLKTIKLKGKDYVQVNERVLYFNELYPKGSITSEATFNGDTVYFKATVFPDVQLRERIFVGHSFGSLKGEKALEKLETVAVGRALAFMGIGIVEGIASADEMEKFHGKDAEKSSTAPYTGKCSICGTQGIAGRFGAYCPNYKEESHKGKPKPTFKIPPTYTSEEQKFIDSLEDIPVIEN